MARDREVDNPFTKDLQITAIHGARRYLGDRLTRVATPHRLLDPDAGPLIAVKLHILTRKTLGGLQTDLDGRVLRADGEPLPGALRGGRGRPASAAAACTATARSRGRSSAAACSRAGRRDGRSRRCSSRVAPERLGPRALGRATLTRQLLLQRWELTPLEAVEHLVGLQSQVPRDPYVALWSRLHRFRPESLSELLSDRSVVRTTVMRGTIHLVSAGDCLTLRPLMQPVLDAELARHPQFAPPLDGVDLGPVLDARAASSSRNGRSPARELRAALAERFPHLDSAALAYACRCKLALVQVPPRGLWRRSAQVTTTTAETWLGRPLAKRPSLDDVVLRYLRRVRPGDGRGRRDVVPPHGDARGASSGSGRVCVTFRDDAGRELFDLPDAPRPDPDDAGADSLPPRVRQRAALARRPKPLRHRGRARRCRDADRPRPRHRAARRDGRGGLARRAEGDRVTVVVTPVVRLTKRATASIEAEGRRLARFLADGAAGDVRVAS